MDDKLFLKGAWSYHVTNFTLAYARDFKILYTGWSCEIIASRLTNRPSSGRGYGLL